MDEMSVFGNNATSQISSLPITELQLSFELTETKGNGIFGLDSNED